MNVDSDMYGVEKNSFLDSSFQVDEDTTIPVYADVQLYPCSNCGRNFNVESLVTNKTLQRSINVFLIS